MNNKLFLGLLILAAGVLVGWYVLRGSVPTLSELTGIKTQNEQLSTPSGTAIFQEENSVGMEITDKGGVAARSVVTYTDTGFAPLTITVKSGSIVTFVNESARGMWVASDMHPTHQLLPGFDQKTSVARGQTFEYTFTTVGTWRYHNHQNPTDTATVVVN